jgi:putative sterol carrier protein
MNSPLASRQIQPWSRKCTVLSVCLSVCLVSPWCASSNGVYLFTIDNKHHWTVDLKNGDGSVKQGEHGKVDCTVMMAEKDFVELMTGKLNGQSAFMSGKLKIKGAMNLAMKLGELAKAAPKAKL